MSAERETNGKPALLKALFIVVTTLLVGALGYAGWIVMTYWDRVGV